MIFLKSEVIEKETGKKKIIEVREIKDNQFEYIVEGKKVNIKDFEPNHK
jgi:hypothetical protein